jgi:transposase
MQKTPLSTAKISQKTTALTPLDMAELLKVKDREIVHLRRQVAWFQRQIFGQKSERRLPEPEGVQGTLGEAFATIHDEAPPSKKTLVASHTRASKVKPIDGSDESAMFFDDKKVPVQVIAVANPEIDGLDKADYEVIGEKVSHRLAQRPGSYVILKYVRPVIKRRDTQTISCPAAPVG